MTRTGFWHGTAGTGMARMKAAIFAEPGRIVLDDKPWRLFRRPENSA